MKIKLVFAKPLDYDTVFYLLSGLGRRVSFRRFWKKEQILWTYIWLDIGQDMVYLRGHTPIQGPSRLFGSLVSVSVWVFLFSSIKLLE